MSRANLEIQSGQAGLRTIRKAGRLACDLIVRIAFELFDRFLPIRKDFWCFATWQGHPHTLDNPRAVFEEVKNDPTIRKIILLKSGGGPPFVDGLNVRFVHAESIQGAYYLARSRVVLLGYALRAMTSFSSALRPGRHLVIQLWHGVPLKRIGHLFEGETFWKDETHRYAATVCSSERDRDIMGRAFTPIAQNRVWQSGLPRNDLLLKEEEFLPEDYRTQLEQIDSLRGSRRLVLYAPTWRESTASLYTFSFEEESRLEQLLEKHGAVLAIRGHSNVRSASAYARRSGAESIIYVNDIPDVSTLLRKTDVLITDYSSIYIDFLLLDRPIIHFAYDLDSYVGERGFLYDLDEAFAGPCAETFSELLSSLDSALADPSDTDERRERAFHLFHSHSDNAASDVCERIRRLVA